MTNPVLNVANVIALGFIVGLYWREAGDFLKRQLFGLAERLKRAHLRRAAAARSLGHLPGPAPFRPGGGSTEGGTMDNHKAGVAQLLGSAAGAAEALTDCGIDCDDTELVANFIASLEDAHRRFVKMIEESRARMLANGVPYEDLNDQQDTLRLIMDASPATTSMMTMWRLATIMKAMASRDVVEAAREVVEARKPWTEAALRHGIGPNPSDHDALDRAVAKLAAALPKEG